MRNCYEYQEMISRLLDEELSAEETQALHAHMRECDECRRMYDAFSALSASIAEDMAEPPEELAAGVMFKVRNTPVVRKKRFRIGHYAALAACLAIVVLAASQSNLLRGGMHKSMEPQAESISMIADAADDMAPVPMPEAEMDGGVKFSPEEPSAADDSGHVYYSYTEDYSEESFDSVTVEADTYEAPEAPDHHNETVETQTLLTALPETLTCDGQTYRMTGMTKELPVGSNEVGTIGDIFPADAAVIDDSGVSPTTAVFAFDDAFYLRLTNGIYALYQLKP